jgi:hypothetical protein
VPRLSTLTETNLNRQGFVNLDEEAKARYALPLRFTPGVGTALIVIGLVLQSPIWLGSIALVALSGALLPNGASPQPDEACGCRLEWLGLRSGRITRDGGAGRVYDCLWQWLAWWPPDPEPEPVMTVARTVADVLTEHVTFEVECIDRLFLNVYQPKLQYAAGLACYVHQQLGLPIASTAPLGKISDRFTRAVHRFAESEGIEWVDFGRGDRKDDVMQDRLRRFTPAEGVVFIGRAQEKNTVFRTEKRRHPSGVAYPWIVRASGVINQFYFYCVDCDFGPFFLKFSSYFPYTAKLCINGHHWAQRQAARAGIGFTAMDNAFAAVDDPAALQAICDMLGPGQIQVLLDKWLAILPNPFTQADVDAGYRYQLSVLQAEFSLTQMLDTPVSGRIFFEQVIRDNLDIGRPDQVSLVFERGLKRTGPRATPGRFRTRVITDGVTPSLHVDYKHTTIKQYHKEGRALRTETTINDSMDFVIRKGLVNLPALREIGLRANRRLLSVQRLDHDPITGTRDLHTITDPVITDTGTRIPGLRLGDQRSHALLSALLIFRLQPNGFTNRDLRNLTAQLRGLPPETVTAGQMTYDLRRLRTHGLIGKIPHSHRYQITDNGLSTAMFLTRVHDRLLPTGMAILADTHQPRPLRAAATAYQTAFEKLTTTAGLAA